MLHFSRLPAVPMSPIQRTTGMTDAKPSIPSTVAIEMSLWEWQQLIGELEMAMSVINRNKATPKRLAEKIATQLNGGVPVVYQLGNGKR